MSNLENPTKEQLNKMKLHELAYITSECELPESDGSTKTVWHEILKVQGGWIYYKIEDERAINSCFVPGKPGVR
jgi:hypothetical protein